MKPYQQEYLELLRSAARSAGPSAGQMEPEAFAEALREANRASQRAVARGTQLLREELFPVLDNILASSEEETRSIFEFAGELVRGTAQMDVGLHYRIHLALMTRARHRGDRDMLIRELYMVGMSLYNLETMLSPNPLRLYTSRMRMCFAESASYFDTQYDDITDPEIRGYIHRSMGNIALSYNTNDPKTAQAKLTCVNRSIEILSDPDIQAKTPSLPWDTFLYKSHQERTTLLSFLRSGNAGPDAFAKVLESAQIVQERQVRAARERGEPLQPRWQYAYLAARYHCGAMLLPELLEGLYGLSSATGDDDIGVQSMFSHVNAPALYFEYSKHLKDSQYDLSLTVRAERMIRRMFRWIATVPVGDENEQLMFYLRQFLYVYRELPGLPPFFEVLQNVFAARHPATYARMWITGQAARELALWAADDCPEQLAGLPGFESVQSVIWNREALGEFACRAGRLCDTGMVHFLHLENSACRGLFEEEEALIQLHAHCGAELLSQLPSTAVFADVARGHHRAFDEKGGYPLDFSLSQSPVRPIICIVAAADALASAAEETSTRYRPVIPFEEVCESIQKEAGRQYAPFVAALLGPPERRDQLKAKLEAWKREAYLDMYRRRAQMLEG